jgi:hypothetical protein
MYKKYKNRYGWCTYPFENSGLGYCWGYAYAVDDNASKKDIKKMCSGKLTEDDKDLSLKKGDYYCEFYKECGK